jgi:hypothetical protein
MRETADKRAAQPRSPYLPPRVRVAPNKSIQDEEDAAQVRVNNVFFVLVFHPSV